MNREMRRRFNKEHGTNYTKQQLEVMVALSKLNGEDRTKIINMMQGYRIQHLDNEKYFPDGTLVKLNYKNIYTRPKEEITEEYRNWVEENKDKEFHLTREDTRDSLVSLEEDVRMTTIDGEEVQKPRWLFDLYSEIMVKHDGEWKSVYEVSDILDEEFKNKESKE